MTRDDARAFIIALNNIQPYVPPILFQQVAGSPVIEQIQRTASERPMPEQQGGGDNVERLRPAGE